MPSFTQMWCVLVIAVGAGLVAFSNKFEPQFNLADPTTLIHSSPIQIDSVEHVIASVTNGLGVGLLIMGLLELVMPWVNKLRSAMTSELSDNSARTIAVATIWVSLAVILTFGVFDINWTGAAGLSVVLIVVAMLCSAATIASAMVCGWRPWIRSSHEMPLTVPQGAHDVSAGNL